MALSLRWETWGLPSMFAAAEMRHREYLAEAARELALARARSAGGASAPWIGTVRWHLGGALARAGARLRGEDPFHPVPAAPPAPNRDGTEIDGEWPPAIGRPYAVGRDFRCPTCRRPVWPPPDLAAAAAVAAAETLIRRHQRQPAP